MNIYQFGVLLIAFIAWEHRLGPRAILRTAMFRRRTQIGTCLEAVSAITWLFEVKTNIICNFSSSSC